MNVAFISNNRMTCMYILYSGGASENGGHLLIKDICAQSHECPLLSGLTVVTIHGSVRCTFLSSMRSAGDNAIAEQTDDRGIGSCTLGVVWS